MQDRQTKRLYILTGKGGVGKTTLSLALTRHLGQSLNKKACFVSFNQEISSELFENLNIQRIDLSLEESTKAYIGRKLNSTTIASWIMKTPFFSALYNMLPSLGQMVTLGHILDKLKEDPELVIVLDSPASGHALSMFESTHNFKKIFGQGPIVQDIEKMHELLYSPEFMKICVLTLPTEMAIQEAIELKQHLSQLKFNCVDIIANECLSVNETLKMSEGQLPEIISKKLAIEKQLLNEVQDVLNGKISYQFENQLKDLINLLEPLMEELV